MKNLSIKLTTATLTFFIGVSVVCLWYLSRLEAETKQSFSDATTSVTPVKFTVENPCDYPQPKNRDLQAEEAIHLAECFIIQNGYTDLPPMADRSKLTAENLYPGTDEEGLKGRHDTLERKAYSYYRSELYGGSWVVMFRYRPHPDVVKSLGKWFDRTGRAVVMDYFGKDIIVMHSNYPLRMPEAILVDAGN